MIFSCFSSSSSQSCLVETLASAWVDFYHAAFVSKHVLAKQNEEIRLSLIQKELSNCQNQLCRREAELQDRLTVLESEALARKRAKDLAGAKKRMVERRRVQAQLEKLQNSMNTIDLHRNTIEGSVLDRTVLETLRASGDALRQMGASSGGIRAVEDIVADVEAQMENAAEITKIISTGSVSGMVNTMAIDGIVLDEDELMRELDELDMPENENVDEKNNEAQNMLLSNKLPAVPELSLLPSPSSLSSSQQKKQPESSRQVLYAA